MGWSLPLFVRSFVQFLPRLHPCGAIAVCSSGMTLVWRFAYVNMSLVCSGPPTAPPTKHRLCARVPRTFSGSSYGVRPWRCMRRRHGRGGAQRRSCMGTWRGCRRHITRAPCCSPETHLPRLRCRWSTALEAPKQFLPECLLQRYPCTATWRVCRLRNMRFATCAGLPLATSP